ncbi:MAG: MerR family transcriptional regulator [Xanthomonadales bacterium]|nr:MerR family transcriptional regulator [Xanthomonadales bacterium]
MSTSDTYTIAAAAEQSGLTPYQVRNYLAMRLVRPCARSDGGFQLFDADCIQRLRLIKACRDAGIGLAEIGVFTRSLDGEDRARCREAERLLAQQLRDKRQALDRCVRVLSAAIEAS